MQRKDRLNNATLTHTSFMKSICIILALLATLASTQAQGTMLFTAQLTNELDSRTASFSLTTNRLDCSVGTVGLNRAQIRGPGSPESPAPVLFDLRLSV